MSQTRRDCLATLLGMPSDLAGASRATARVTKRRVETRARMLEAAFVVLARRGFGRATIEEICAEAGYTRMAFYSQFASMDELFFVLYDQQAELLVIWALGGTALSIGAAKLRFRHAEGRRADDAPAT